MTHGVELCKAHPFPKRENKKYNHEYFHITFAKQGAQMCFTENFQCQLNKM